MIAAEDGNCRTLARCIKSGAPIDYRPPTYSSRPLVVAIVLSRPRTVEWLLDHGANPNSASYDDAASEPPCPLAQAVEYAIRPGILHNHIPRRWERQGIKVPCRKRHQQNSREIIKALRRAGADEQPLGDTERLHLDSIEAGTFCCSQHKPRLWYQRR
ncbi:ankyrin repeats (3 copies) domain containing protein [Fusarium agapanthi]|uniref:Ankyrin repeats (3 copies) domain containing protein n=1 Tax=Fusarium agapanthi TaxID=1803897 RepID=A0A9P5AZM3_9HYPO|nr:ankyrin repeats (3 copies) domain containing protein [Fusarium agapanthi]